MIEDQLRTIIANRFLGGDGSSSLSSSTDLLANGICDSLGLVELVAEIEARFSSIRIDDQEITPANLGSIDRIVDFLGRKGIS